MSRKSTMSPAHRFRNPARSQSRKGIPSVFSASSTVCRGFQALNSTTAVSRPGWGGNTSTNAVRSVVLDRSSPPKHRLPVRCSLIHASRSALAEGPIWVLSYSVSGSQPTSLVEIHWFRRSQRKFRSAASLCFAARAAARNFRAFMVTP